MGTRVDILAGIGSIGIFIVLVSQIGLPAPVLPAPRDNSVEVAQRIQTEGQTLCMKLYGPNAVAQLPVNGWLECHTALGTRLTVLDSKRTP